MRGLLSETTQRGDPFVGPPKRNLNGAPSTERTRRVPTFAPGEQLVARQLIHSMMIFVFIW